MRTRSFTRTSGSISNTLLFLLCGIFFVSLIYEIASDGISGMFAWLPPIQWVNFAGDTFVNILQIIIFSLVSAAVGSRYHHSGSVKGQFSYRKFAVEKPGGANGQGGAPAKQPYSNYGRGGSGPSSGYASGIKNRMSENPLSNADRRHNDAINRRKMRK